MEEKMKGMSLKRKVFAIFIAALLLLTLIFFVGADLFIDEIILKVEKAHIKVDAERVYSFVERETETLEMYAEDWAVWDDTYNFVVNGNENYIRSNLLYNTFKILSVNYILILDRSGNVIFSRGYNLKNGREIGVPEELVRFAAQSGDRGLKGIVKTSDNITVAAVEPVLKSDGSGPSVGVFVLGRIFDEGYIKNISDTLGIKISKAETENRITELKEALYLKNGQPLWIKTISPKKSEGYFALKDVLGNDALLLKMDFIRHANIAFLSLRRFFVAFLIFSISAYCISTLLWFDRAFLSRLFTLISAIKSIDRSFLNSYYIPEFKEKDELSVLSNEVKNLLERLETYQREIEDKERKYSTVVENSAEAIFVTQNKIIRYANPAASKLLGVAKEELISRSLEDFVFADDLEKKKKHVVDLINKGKKVIYGFDFRLKAADGSIKWVEGSLVLIDWDGSDAVLYFLNDVTYRKIMEEEYQRLLDEKNLVLDGIEELVLFIDRDMRIITANKKACEVAGRSREEIFGGKCYELIPKGKEICKSCPVLEAIWTKKVAAGEIYSADGRIWSAKATPVKDKNGKVTGAVEVLLDITDKKKYEERLKHMSMYDSLTGLYNRAYFEEEINRLSLMKGKFPTAILIADMDGLKEINDSMGHSKGDEMLKICADLLKGVLRSSDVLARIGGDEFAAVLPGVDEEKAQKIVQRVYDAVDRYNEKHQEIPLSISVGIAVQERENEPLEETFKKADDLMYQNKLLKQSSSRSHVVRALLAALKEKDFISAGHAKRLEEYCVKMGQKMGLSFEKIADLSLLAQVHDLGKVVIPDEILFKKGPLSEEEWEIMRQHPVRGSRIALSSPDLTGIADLILKHHERWDGKGYPLGLKREDIPIECRILAVADAFDAMTNDRPYRRAMKKEEALKEIKNEAGKQFDPQVVEVFLSMFTGKDDKEVINLNEKRAN